MHQDIISLAFACLLGLVVALGFGFALFLMNSEQLLRPRAGRQGDWVAEVWLDWEICRGSTMYRQRFSHRWTAYLATRFHALVLDGLLPTHYRDTDWNGRPCRYRHEYAILYGVRKVLAGEAQDFTPIWSEVLPGHQDHRGEHASSHPFERWSQKLNETPLDYKV